MTYDCFIFFNELDLLEIRLNTLNDVVDRFVIVEATRTFQGNAKPLHYQENKERYRAFESKIIHVIVDNYSSFFSRWRKPTAWDIEDHQRNQVMQGIINCKADDVIILSDLDEIPKPEQVQQHKSSVGIGVFKQMNFYYFLNCRSMVGSEEWWYGPVMARFKDFRKPQDLRAVSKRMNADNMRILKDKYHRFWRSIINPIYKKEIIIVEDGGWHFGFLGGAKKIIEKLEAFSHDEFNKPEFKKEESIMEAIHSGKDILGRGQDCEFVPIDASYPKYILQNLNKYAHLIKM
ncbi:MAG: hypothetical protein ACKVOQ_01495 [Cyclobacteriaceae bacterium]